MGADSPPATHDSAFTNFFWNVRLDGTEAAHDARASRAGLFAEALDGIAAAKNAGFFVIVTNTIYPGHGCEGFGAIA